MNRIRISPSLGLLAVLVSLPPALISQEIGTLLGTVMDESSRAPLMGAVVSIPDLETTAFTNSDGHFRFEHIPTGDVSVRVEHMAHVTLVEFVTVDANEVTFAHFTLSPVAFVLDQLNVIADRDRPEPPGSPFDELEPTLSQSSQNAMQLLTARFPSLSITSSGGTSGAEKRVLIRGIRSMMMGNSPQLYVDGVLSDLRILDNIPATDVRNIRVLRGAAASSQYSYASNGVILVETRRGKLGGG